MRECVGSNCRSRHAGKLDCHQIVGLLSYQDAKPRSLVLRECRPAAWQDEHGVEADRAELARLGHVSRARAGDADHEFAQSGDGRSGGAPTSCADGAGEEFGDSTKAARNRGHTLLESAAPNLGAICAGNPHLVDNPYSAELRTEQITTALCVDVLQ